MADHDHHDRDEYADGDVALDTDQDEELKRPRLYRVLLHNDDYTTMEFVVQILMDIFHHPQSVSVRIMLNVHYEGIGVAGVFTREIAETKIVQATELARSQEFPLRLTMEPQ